VSVGSFELRELSEKMEKIGKELITYIDVVVIGKGAL